MGKTDGHQRAVLLTGCGQIELTLDIQIIDPRALVLSAARAHAMAAHLRTRCNEPACTPT